MSKPEVRQDIDLWKDELSEAGWIKVRRDVWSAPDNTLHRGPYGAWVKMQQGRHAKPVEVK